LAKFERQVMEYETISIGQAGNMLMVSANGTAVVCEE
jgi:uncharacterized protein YbjQ (UPF0145 family)